jgi:N-sulfoglucosamine sulfohydrolase
MRPNILFITADDLNYNSLGVTGCGIQGITLNLDKLASDGIRFDHAHVSIAVCQPSRSVLMTGRYPHRNGALGFDPIDETVPTLPEQLSKAHYLNGIIGKEDHLTPAHKFAWDVYISTLNDENGMGRSPQAYYKHCKDFFQRAISEGRPFFLMANSHDPHRPFAGSEQEREKFGYNTKVTKQFKPEEVEVPGFLPDLPRVRQEIAEYYSSVHRLDETVGEILRALKEVGQEDNTLVMFLSDNGMAFPYAKANCYLNSTRTPWIVRWPGVVRPGQMDDRHFISGIDFMPTILEAAGLPKVEGMDGRSFMPLLNGGEQDWREDVFTVFNRTFGKKEFPMRCVQNKRFGYIYNAWSDQKTVYKNESQSGLTFAAMREASLSDRDVAARVSFFEYRVKEEFYDFERDPEALHNLIDAPENQATIEAMRKRLLEHMHTSGDPVMARFRQEAMKGEEC